MHNHPEISCQNIIPCLVNAQPHSYSQCRSTSNVPQVNTLFSYSQASQSRASQWSFSFPLISLSFFFSFVWISLYFPLWRWGQIPMSLYHPVYIDLWSIANHPRICRAWRSVSLGRGILVVERKHILLWSLFQVEGRCILIPYASIGSYRLLSLAKGSLERALLVISLRVDTDIVFVLWPYRPWLAMWHVCASLCWVR